MDERPGDKLTLQRILELHGYKTPEEVPGYPRTLPYLIKGTRNKVNRYGEQWVRDNQAALRYSMEELASL